MQELKHVIIYNKSIVEQEVEGMAKNDDSGTIKDIVTEQELKAIKFEVRALLLIERVNKEDFTKKLFKKYKDDGAISIKKLIKKLSKKPLKLSFVKSKLLARYMIEPKEEKTIEYNAKRKKEVRELKEELDEFLAITYELTSDREYEREIKNALQKAAGKLMQIKKYFDEETVDLNKWHKILNEHLPSLSQLHEDILLSLVFEQTRDMNNLTIDVRFV